MPQDLKNLPKPQKKALATLMRQEGMSLRQMEQYLGADHVTISRWVKQEQDLTEKQQQETLKLFQKEIGEHNRKILSLAINRLEELIPDEKNISEVIKAAEYASGKSKENVNQTNLQVNIVSDQIKTDYGEI
ncbi:hypothetical protein IJJ27_04330 [bacterium]|nr:hypothetical protein [bacterium]